jgi:asparagine synthase (glutamine-hydrolysing)
MGDSLRHRGPDGQGVWLDASAGIGMAHRRLAIVELSDAGAQPMLSHCGRYVLSFNGEIYNYLALRRELEAFGNVEWRGHSDTEVLLCAIGRWGLEQALQRCNGMFAIALWDRSNRELTLARDRTGEKPLYVGWVGSDIVFGSELRAFRCHPDWRQGVEPLAVARMLRLGYVPAPLSIHPNVYKLPAASLLRLRARHTVERPSAEQFAAWLEYYWDIDEVVQAALDDPWRESAAAAMDAIRGLLDDSVQLRMLADVPVGALLSGGIDSSLVVASMQRQSAKPVKTFTVGFDEPSLDESGPARDVARMLGTDHEHVRLPATRALDLVERLPDVYDEPFADAAQLPALLVSEATSRRVKVALTGDGGDELFHGYQRYLDAARAWRLLRHLSPGARRRTASWMHLLGKSIGPGALAQTLRRQGSRIGASDEDHYYANVLVFPGALQLRSGQVSPRLDFPARLELFASRMRYVDQRLGLPEGIHTKLDRASMTTGLELRVPLLDHRLLALAWRMPQTWLANGRTGKLLLRRMLERELPGRIASRPKQGFDVPVASWLRGPLREWATDFVESRTLKDDPLIDAAEANARFADHVAGRADNGYALWALLMYLAWSRRYG